MRVFPSGAMKCTDQSPRGFGSSSHRLLWRIPRSADQSVETVLTTPTPLRVVKLGGTEAGVTE